MKSKVKYSETVAPLNGMLKGMAEMVYRQRKGQDYKFPTYEVKGHAYPYIHLEGHKILFNDFGMAMYIQKTPIDDVAEVDE